mgnify:FL=1
MKTKVLAVFDKIEEPVGGAEYASLSFLRFLKPQYEIVLLCRHCNYETINRFTPRAKVLNVKSLNRYPTIKALQLVSSLLEKITLVYVPRMAFWISSLALRKSKPVITHLHDHFTLCPYPHKLKILNKTLREISICYDKPSISCFKCLFKYKNAIIELTRSTSVETRLKAKTLLSCLADSLLAKKYFTWLSKSNTIIVSSNAHKNYVMTIASKILEQDKEKLRELERKIIVVPNPIPENIHAKDKKYITNTLLYVGGMNIAKGISFIAKLASKLTSKCHEAELIVNVTKEQIQQVIWKMYGKSIPGNVNAVGKLSKESVLKYMGKSLAILFPYMGLPNFTSYVVVEAALSARPFIAPNIGGIGEYWKTLPTRIKDVVLYEHSSYRNFESKVFSILTFTRDEIYDVGCYLREFVIKKHSNEKLYEKFNRIFDALASETLSK